MQRAIAGFLIVFAVCAVVVGVALARSKPDHPPHPRVHQVERVPLVSESITTAAHDEQVRRMLITAYITPTTTTTIPPKVREQQPATTSEYAPQGFLDCVRRRESRGQYGVTDGSGNYGAYQFNQNTWNNTASHAGRSDLVGVNPAAASPSDQDAMAQSLLAWQGTGPWQGGSYPC